MTSEERAWDLVDLVSRQLAAIRNTIPECIAGDRETAQHLNNIQRTCDELLTHIAEEIGEWVH